LLKPEPRIYLLDDDELVVQLLSRALKREGYQVKEDTTGTRALAEITAWSPHVVLLDVKLPGINGLDLLQEITTSGLTAEVVMLTADDTAETAIRAMKLGAADYLTKPFNIEEVAIVIRKILEKESLKQEVDHYRRVTSEIFERDVIGTSESILALRNKIRRIAQAHVTTVLLTGESGTGKEVLARHIHEEISGTFEGGYRPFIAINCAALPETLLESELFGHEKGSFTDAKTLKRGVFEQAGTGSVLLDEIGDMKTDLQAKLLRVLEGRSFRRIGGKAELPVMATVMAATNRDMASAVEKGLFRRDLFYRLNTFSLNLPPLRERVEDIPLLAMHFLRMYAKKYNNQALQGISKEAREILNSYRWPGNIRELKNVIERIVVLENTEQILPRHLPHELSERKRPEAVGKSGGFLLPAEGLSLEDLETDLIRQALERTQNNKTAAAKLLNMTYDSLRYHIKKFDL